MLEKRRLSIRQASLGPCYNVANAASIGTDEQVYLHGLSDRWMDQSSHQPPYNSRLRNPRRCDWKPNAE